MRSRNAVAIPVSWVVLCVFSAAAGCAAADDPPSGADDAGVRPDVVQPLPPGDANPVPPDRALPPPDGPRPPPPDGSQPPDALPPPPDGPKPPTDALPPPPDGSPPPPDAFPPLDALPPPPDGPKPPLDGFPPPPDGFPPVDGFPPPPDGSKPPLDGFPPPPDGPPPFDAMPPPPDVVADIVQPSALTVIVSQVATSTIGSLSYGSSSRLRVQFTDSAVADHYEVVATESGQGTSVTASVAGGGTEAELTGLKAGTVYSITVVSCSDTGCSDRSRSGTGTGQTFTELWQLRGTGNTFAQATQIVNSGATLSYALRMGTEAPSSSQGFFQLYYNPKGTAEWTGGTRIASTASALSDEANFSAYTAIAAAGLKHPCSAPETPSSCPSGGGAFFIQASQPVPLAGLGKVRLFFEAQDLSVPEKTARIYYLDSQDGYLGRDFDTRSTSAACGQTSNQSDYRPGGPCEPTLVIGVQSDTVGGGTGLKHARQFRVGMPRTSFTWDMAPGSFMAFTGEDACGKWGDNAMFHATWDGTKWTVAQDGSGCATAIASFAQGPTMLQTGATEQKLYYRDESQGKSVKKTRIAYIRAEHSGSSTSFDLADWEATANHRQIRYFWPDNTELSATEASAVGDLFVFALDGDLSKQYMYLNLDSPSQGLGLAKLVNP